LFASTLRYNLRMTADSEKDIQSLKATGRKLHESPRDILNYYNPADRTLLNEGLVLAIEPFLTTGVGRVIEERDGWSLRTSDQPSPHSSSIRSS
jgi:methionine aminopeptidase